MTFEEAMKGTQRQLTVTRRETCRSCRGTGMLSVAEPAVSAVRGPG